MCVVSCVNESVTLLLCRLRGRPIRFFFFGVLSKIMRQNGTFGSLCRNLKTLVTLHSEKRSGTTLYKTVIIFASYIVFFSLLIPEFIWFTSGGHWVLLYYELKWAEPRMITPVMCQVSPL